MSRLQESVVDCEASLEKDPGCLAAMLCRARYRDLSGHVLCSTVMSRCHKESKEWEAAVRLLERMNNRDRSDGSRRPGFP